MTDKAPELEIRLLLLRYGRRRVVEALARLGDQRVEDVEREISSSECKTKRKRSQPSSLDIVASEGKKRPEIAHYLNQLANSYEARTFLPQLRDVVRFLEQGGVTVGRPKSRTAAAPTLFRALGKMEPAELRRLTTSSPSEADGDFALLARAIMRNPRE